MILAVPITAVLKIQLDSIDHPASKFLVRLLVGGAGGADDGAMALQPAEDTIHSGAAGSSTRQREASAAAQMFQSKRKR